MVSMSDYVQRIVYPKKACLCIGCFPHPEFPFWRDCFDEHLSTTHSRQTSSASNMPLLATP